MNIPISHRRALLLAATMALIAPATQTSAQSGYVSDQQEEVRVRSTDGQCVRTSAWSPEFWNGECNAGGVTEVIVYSAPPTPDPMPAAVTPAPAPTPVERSAVAQEYVQPEPTPPIVVAYVAPLPVDKIILPADTLFDIDKAVIKPAGMVALDELVRKLRGNTRIVLPVGHTSSPGTNRHNMGLSLRRAYAVKDYLVSQGIDPARIRPSGQGEDHPIASNATVAGRTQNRRVEIDVLATPKDAKW